MNKETGLAYSMGGGRQNQSNAMEPLPEIDILKLFTW